MAAVASSSRSPPVADMTLLNELYEEIDTNPPALEARKLLIQQCMEAGWIDAARDAIQDLLSISPFDEDAHNWADTLSENISTQRHSRPSPVPAPLPPQPPLPGDIESAQLELLRGYEALRIKAAKLLRETRLVRDLARQNGVPKTENRGSSSMNVLGSVSAVAKKKEEPFSSGFETQIQDLTDLAGGRISSVVRVRQPGSAQSVACAMERDPDRALDIAISDLEDMARWLRSATSQATPLDSDGVREALVRRVGMLSAALSDETKKHASTALMHVEHEILGRTYVCDETMYGDSVADIPRARFLVTEDGYPWDMEELAQAIASNGGAMRNPLSGQMFTTNDIRTIVQHPLGKRLAALQIEQSKLSQGVRPKTIEELEKMSAVLLADMSLDQMESRRVVEAFRAYVATLPDLEQNALDRLRVPAKDSHTGQTFDTSIGEAVQDSLAGKLCFHKTGDLLKQAVWHLRSKQSQVPESAQRQAPLIDF